MKATVGKNTGFSKFDTLHTFECSSTLLAKKEAEKLTGKRFKWDGRIGRYSIYRAVDDSRLLLSVELR